MPEFDFLKDAADPSTIQEDFPSYRPLRQKATPEQAMLSSYKPPPDNFLLVVHPITNEVIGHLNYPTEFCKGIHCPHGNDIKYNTFSYYNLITQDGNRRWAHVTCDMPTPTWWDRTVKDIVAPLKGKTFPWEQAPQQ